MLDRYIVGDVSRINPEAPVPVVTVEKEHYAVGGTGNVASNLSSLGANVFLFSFIGKDNEAEVVKKILNKKKINYYLEQDSQTIQKSRIVGKNQQIVRFDKEIIKQKIFSNKTKQIILKKARQADIIVVSDYAKGAVTNDLIELLSGFKDKLIIHPKPTNQFVDSYGEALLIIPNKKEALELSNCIDLEQAGKEIRKIIPHVLITLGEKGMVLYSDKKINIPTYAKEVYEVSGASDTVVAAVALSIAAGASFEEAAIIANHAAGIAVGKKGIYSVRLKELKDKFDTISLGAKKIVNLNELKKIIKIHKQGNKKIVFTNGCYDILHPGHFNTLTESSKQGDILIAALNSDISVKKFKGEGRPFFNERARAEMVAGIKGVDYVILFDDENVLNLLKEIRPNILVKGGNPLPERVQKERDIIESYGGQVVLLPLIKGFSTTEVVEKIKNTENI